MRRRRRVILWVVGSIGVGIAGLVVAFLLSTPSVEDLPVDVATKEIPWSWIAPEEGVSAPADLPADPIAPFVSAGKLMLIGRGKPFGEEVYELRIAEDRATLSSSGRFWFRVVLATVQVAFEQSFEGDSELRPIAYAAEFHAPLGFDRAIRASTAGDQLTIERSDGSEQLRIDPERTFVLGTFSSYALLPRLLALRQTGESASFDVLFFGGPPNQGPGADAPEDKLPVLKIERAGSASLRAGEIVLEVDRYVVSSDLGTSELFARGDEFLALRAGEGNDSILVYRSDFFPNGIELLDAAATP